MGSVDTDEVAAVPGLRAAVGFYSGKVGRLLQRKSELEAELALVAAEVAKVSATRDQLREALEEILADAPPPVNEETAPDGPAGDGSPQTESGPNTDPPPGQQDRAPADDDPPPPRTEVAAGQRTATGELMEAVERILVTAGRSMPVRDITEALGRPTRGKAGRGPLATVRGTCKRLVKNGRVVEEPVGMFAVARANGSPTKEAA
ncbi:hypothetical protein [Streptomyces caatingaensis]|uniref:Uncharacterized protein n=1 Tax=Streptomyces caatingaensis TaxID=1678637 RepID=A0A0K9XIR8_9ACTN|nr:hypothetical protein [Streptomyces caatingaensis]KNB48984.1 hypothetical protein AC230_26870 [Streptomyces caatingaensis]KNB53255.1 hypothetical protein AC230_07390 [Streptomyces caatingaensis]KNB54444.1 hypothetical protein AC230_00800 [Streptomyces caatingaensis]